MPARGAWSDTFIHFFFRNVPTGVGAGLATISFGAIVVLTIAELSGVVESPYLGILTFILLPAVFLLGLFLIPVGIWWERRKAHHSHALAPHEFPRIDLNDSRTRRTVFLVVFLTGVNLFVVSAATYKGSVYMESPQFCGQVCHTIMEPEYTAYLQSPHSAIHCVDCHYGPGAEGYLDAKMGGLRQLFHMAQDSYSKPIPAPVAHMDWANVTCLECHWPGKHIGDRLHVRRKYSEDEANTELTTVFVSHVGGGDAETGIHSYHMNSKRSITYYFADDKRESIPYVKVTEPDGTITEYFQEGETIDPATIDIRSMRHMDCLDCHNRPSHAFELPDLAVDALLAEGTLPRDLPYLKATAVEALRAAADTANGPAHIEEHVSGYFAENYPEIVETRAPAIAAAIDSIQEIYQKNVFPKMNITWGTYPNHIGHTHATGCFRCHDDSHVSSDGRVIRQDCTICHNVLAWDEESPDILGTLGL